MKKIGKFMVLSLALSAIGFSIGAVANHQKLSFDKTEALITDYEYYVPVNTTNFWSNEYTIGDQIWGGNSTFFDDARFFGTTRPFINTVNTNEGSTGDIRSDDFTQTGDYVSFLIGGNPNYSDGNPQNFVNLWSTDKGYNIASNVANDAFSDPNISCNMIFKYVYVPEEYRGKCLIYIHDGTTGNFGGVTFGDLRINQSWDDVVEAYSAHIATYRLSCDNTANTNACSAVLNYYSNTSYYDALNTAVAAKTSANDGFEKKNSLTNWAYDRLSSVDESSNKVLIDFENIISDVDYKTDGYFTVPMPANKSGTYYINADTSGIAEACSYRLVSSEFKLSGSGFISAKLGGGTAVLQLLSADCSTVLAQTSIADASGTNILNPGFVSGDHLNIMSSGARLNTMSKVYLDCSDYLSQQVRVALADARTGGNWGLAYFDDVVTYYENAPTSFGVESIIQTNGSTNYYGVVREYYSGSSSTTVGQAYSFLDSFYGAMRNVSNNNSWCDVSQTTDVQNLLTSYNALSSSVKAIVDASQDFVHMKDSSPYYGSDFYLYSVDTSTYNVGVTMAYLDTYSSSVVSSRILGFMNQTNTKVATISVVIVAIVLFSIFGVYSNYRKKRKTY